MKQSLRPPHVTQVLAFLRKIGAFVSRIQHARRIVIAWRWRGHHGVTDLPKATSDPIGCALKAMAGIAAHLGLTGLVTA